MHHALTHIFWRSLGALAVLGLLAGASLTACGTGGEPKAPAEKEDKKGEVKKDDAKKGDAKKDDAKKPAEDEAKKPAEEEAKKDDDEQGLEDKFADEAEKDITADNVQAEAEKLAKEIDGDSE